MAVFDAYIRKVNEYVEGMRADGRQVRELDRPGEPSTLLAGLQVKVGPNSGSGIVLRGDTFTELGSPEAGSCAFPLWTNNTHLVRDGRITLIGPDIPESAGGAGLPFGQVLVAGGEGISDKEHSALDENQYASDRIEGYMTKSTPGRMWCRVSKDAAAKGFDFETLGRALMAILKSEVPKVQAMEVVFVTSSKADVQRLCEIGEQVRKISKDIVRETWLAREVVQVRKKTTKARKPGRAPRQSAT
jgi:CO dehydrogenase/acetyl-CoA synthase beta subunit